jgi:hypothetical protein
MLAMPWVHPRESMRKTRTVIRVASKRREKRGKEEYRVLLSSKTSDLDVVPSTVGGTSSGNNKLSLCPNNAGPLTLDKYHQVEKIRMAEKEEETLESEAIRMVEDEQRLPAEMMYVTKKRDRRRMAMKSLLSTKLSN